MMATSKPIIYVDLDGTLSPSDLLVESCLLLLKLNVLYGFCMIWWALRGAWVFKTEVAKRVSPNTELFPINPELLRMLEQFKSSGHTLVLATASMKNDVEKLASRLGCFDRVIASETSNLKGVKKLQAIKADAQGSPFYYFGDAAVDIPIWKEAEQAFAVNPGLGVISRAKAAGVNVTEFKTSKTGRIKLVLKAMRVQQWAKNALLFLPLIAAHSTSLGAWMQMVAGFVAFGLVASATYIWNDLMDLNSDRHHPRKKFRPMASGELSLAAAFLIMKGLGLAGFLLALVLVGPAFSGVLLIYTALTLLYTFKLKRLAFVDVLALAMLYTIRVIAGGVATGIAVSSWLLAISMFVFLSLALVKRCAELEFLELDDEAAKPAGRGYRKSDLSYLVSMGISSGFVAVLVLALYVDSQNGSLLYSEPKYLWGICPVFLFWIMRIWILTSRKEMVDDPVHFAIHDRVSWWVLIAIGVLAGLAI